MQYLKITMIKKIGILILTVLLTSILAGIYGILHNQLSYTISHEYFTKFKFEHFGFVEYGFENERATVAIIGFLATWWTGLIIGAVNGSIGLIQPTSKIMLKSVFGATIRTLGIAIAVGLLGILVGKFIISGINADWNIPNDVIDRNAFLATGTMHDFSYIGGLIGLVFGAFYQVRMRKQHAPHVDTSQKKIVQLSLNKMFYKES